MHQKNYHFNKKGMFKKIIISLVIGIIQSAFCISLYYGSLWIMAIPMKRDISWGIGLWYWWHFQIMIAICAVFFFLTVKKRFVRIIILSGQILLFSFYWYSALFVYPYSIVFLFAITLCSAIIGTFLCCTTDMLLENTNN
ncbi:MAG: hypothetical protein LBK18_06815 [Prevotellaceae bacterium]|jgi:hypothetical protein|nr:hypothetical protein [Prevotellaceae bacterium]